MSKSNTFEADFLALVFLNTNIALVGDATGLRGSSAAGDLYFALHSADPGEGGDQQTSEVSYPCGLHPYGQHDHAHVQRRVPRGDGGFRDGHALLRWHVLRWSWENPLQGRANTEYPDQRGYHSEGHDGYLHHRGLSPQG
jgi:hypothetical protein